MSTIQTAFSRGNDTHVVLECRTHERLERLAEVSPERAGQRTKDIKSGADKHRLVLGLLAIFKLVLVFSDLDLDGIFHESRVVDRRLNDRWVAVG